MGKSRATKPTYAQKQIIAAAGKKSKELDKEPDKPVKTVVRQKKRYYRKKGTAYGN